MKIFNSDFEMELRILLLLSQTVFVNKKVLQKGVKKVSTFNTQ